MGWDFTKYLFVGSGVIYFHSIFSYMVSSLQLVDSACCRKCMKLTKETVTPSCTIHSPISVNESWML